MSSPNKQSYEKVVARITILIIASVTLSGLTMAADESMDESGYQGLIKLTEDFFAWKKTATDPWRQSAEQTARKIQVLDQFQARIAKLQAKEWLHEQQVDYLALRSAMDQFDFTLQVTKPWERDPGYYVDRIHRLAFTELPVSGSDINQLIDDLQSTINLIELAKRNLQNVPRDFGYLAIHNLTQPDGVGHGHPYRTVPPKGVIGWYEDLSNRAEKQQPELLPHIRSALVAVEGFHQWLLERQDQMTAQAGVGEELLDWYLKWVKYMPYTSSVIQALGERELQRTWAFYALEQHRNRKLPALELPTSEAEYLKRLARVDSEIRSFLERESFVSVPDHIPVDLREMGFNVPWIQRPGGPNYWEQIQYRDPSPDHWHAVIPGHRFDARILAKNEHPIRKYFRDGGRMEGWALYLEEAPLQLGFYENRPRTRELIYNFGIFRAARTIGDIRLQHNEVSIPEIVKYWRSKTPWLDDDVARVDAEIYLRRPPGYGLGYTVGSFQLYELLADRKQQLRDNFVLGEFHDQIMAAGALPIALIRYEMTGLDDQIKELWNHQPIESKLAEIALRGAQQ